MRTWLKKRRVEAGLSCKEMASKIGVTESYFYMLEEGIRQKKMDIGTALKLAKALDAEWQSVFEEEMQYERDRAHSA